MRTEVNEGELGPDVGQLAIARPMLQHGLHEQHESRIVVPRQVTLHPNQEYLEERFRRFLAA